MIRRIFGLIPRCLQLLLEVGGIILAYYMAKLQFNDFFDDFFATLFTIYLVTIITLIIGWIFNIFTKFDDYSRGGRLHTILLAPIMLPYRLLIHTYSTIGYLFTGKSCTERHSSVDSSPSTNEPVSSNKLQNLLKNAAYRAANKLRVDSTASARLHSFDCYTLNYVVYVRVTLAISDSYGSVSGFRINNLCTEAKNDIESALRDVLRTHYHGSVPYEIDFPDPVPIIQ